MRMLYLFVFLFTTALTGCQTCQKSCENDHEACIDAGTSANKCRTLKARCLDECDSSDDESSEQE